MRGNKLSVISSYFYFGHFHANEFPALGYSVFGTEFDYPSPECYVPGGGKGHAVAKACYSVGCDVDLILKVGDDVFGQIAYQDCVDYGFRGDHIFRDPNTKTGQGIGIEVNKEWGWMVYPEANYRFTKADIDKCADSIRSSAAISAQLEVNLDAVEYAFDIAQAAGVRTIFDAAPARPLSDSTLSKCSIIKPNQFEAESISGIKVTGPETALDAAQYFLDHGVKEAAIVTLGGDGLVYATHNKKEYLPPIKVPVNMLSSAGDVTCAGLMVASLLDLPMEETVRFAQSMAAIHVSGVPWEENSLEKIEAMYRSVYGAPSVPFRL